ncbi:MAG TPA: BMC domain-containing protein [Bryobacteraceae bacterium]|nr:BMC domain-containing protein [Bryobacteraceae bacterium]
MARNSIGLIELGSIAAGYQVADAMLKTADVELLLSRSICSGKYMVMVRGDVAAVGASVAAGSQAGGFSIIDSFVIPNLHESIFPAIGGAAKVEQLEALGILESFSVASLVEGADAAVKAANVRLIEIRLAMALGGKAFATLTGSVAAVASAVEAGARAIAQKGLLVNKVVIPSPRPELLGDTI